MHTSDGFRSQQLAVLQALLDCAEEGRWETLARRRVCHFGYKFEYQVGTIWHGHKRHGICH